MLRRFEEHPGLAAKSDLAIVREVLGPTDWVGGPGDDAAVVPEESGPAGQPGRPGSRGAAGTGGQVVVAGEAMLPAFVAADPFAAGMAAVVTNVNDIAATGGVPLAIVDTIVGPAAVARRVLEGMAFAAGLYGVPIVGGHLTIADGPASVSAFAVGRAAAVLSATAVRDGQSLLFATCLEGELRGDFPVFSSIRRRGPELAGDVAILPALAGAGAAVAAKDVSMAGLLGSLAMLLEPTRCGVCVDLDAVVRPVGVALADWTAAFLSYGFLLCAEPGREEECEHAFRIRGLACTRIGTIDRSGRLAVRLGSDEATLLDLTTRGVTNLGAGSS